MTTTAPPPAPQAPVERAPHGDGDRAQLARPRKGRPQNFGLNVRRLRRVRAICFAVLAVPLLILALLIVRFVSMPITQAWHDDAYDDGDYPAAAERLGPVSVVNWFEPYLPHLTRGTDLLQEGRNAEAEAELRVSLQKWSEGKDLNQPMHAQCKIINNLAISIERQAQEIEDPAQRADRLFEAEQLMAPCAGGGGGEGDQESEGGNGNEDSETTKGNGERIKEERRKADEEAGNDPSDRPTEEGEGQAPRDPGEPKRNDPEGEGPEEEAPTDGGDDGTDPKEDELEERNKDAQGGDGEDGGGSGADPEKPW